MIPVARVAEPARFDQKARKPGNAWLKAHPNAVRPYDYWSPFLPALASGFADLCGYAAMLDPTGGTVDHYLSFKNKRKLAYEWTNYRFASQTLNASKQNADAAVLDPYVVGDGWFEILLPSLQLQVTKRVPKKWRTVAEYTVQRLKLRDGERVVRWRRRWFEMYEQGKLPLDGLRDVAPLLAAAVEREAKKTKRPRRARKAKP